MNAAPHLRAVADGVQLSIKVQPRASRTEACGLLGDELRVRVTAPPVDDAANEAILEWLADVLKCPRGAVRIVRGRTSRHKVVEITGVTVERVNASLG